MVAYFAQHGGEHHALYDAPPTRITSSLDTHLARPMMKKELEATILAACPTLYRHDRPRFRDLRFECGDGWYELVLAISRLLEAEAQRLQQLQQLRPRKRIRVGVVKEELGRLVFGYEGHVTDEAYTAIEALEVRSTLACDLCGRPGERRGGSWLTVRCDAHVEHERRTLL
ncbi:hypothetical protein [Paraburkholderia sp. GAS42]|uniref:hypothetical protein n=1 Tax=Paraburkholderia sp. GAS42 TaxID=3035135 RepID=UPI003D1F516F